VRTIAYLLCAAALLGCVAPPRSNGPAKMQATFSPDEHQAYAASGSGAITGQGFLRQQGGGVVTCAGSPVFLVPATPYFREMLQFVRAGKVPERPAGGLSRFAKQSQCDAQGNFAFNSLPSGVWLVMTQVSWVAGRYSYEQGGGLMREVTLQPGQAQQVLLTDGDRMR
jgi:hypothetical protein